MTKRTNFGSIELTPNVVQSYKFSKEAAFYSALSRQVGSMKRKIDLRYATYSKQCTCTSTMAVTSN